MAMDLAAWEVLFSNDAKIQVTAMIRHFENSPWQCHLPIHSSHLTEPRPAAALEYYRPETPRLPPAAPARGPGRRGGARSWRQPRSGREREPRARGHGSGAGRRRRCEDSPTALPTPARVPGVEPPAGLGVVVDQRSKVGKKGAFQSLALFQHSHNVGGATSSATLKATLLQSSKCASSKKRMSKLQASRNQQLLLPSILQSLLHIFAHNYPSVPSLHRG
ncbi:uncharacterized protein LOC119282836 [Triticum dicoccoides]|uniref:uncharacterized protein LOC119282836 n=1 Tax=Triticum dicoccoides TaxID=85692 RepID=UPI00188F247A|nr:uncharacterized protein LOC119282836 [Triticum dicoccoides]